MKYYDVAYWENGRENYDHWTEEQVHAEIGLEEKHILGIWDGDENVTARFLEEE